MITKKMISGFAAITLAATITLTGCKKDKDEPVPTPVPDPLKTTYILKTKDVVGVSGTVSFAEASSGSSETVVTIVLTGASAVVHPAHIHANSALEGGGIIHSLTDVSAAGSSTTTLSVPYNTLINFDGYVNVHEGALIIAQGDIGGNVITTTNKTYALLQDSTSGVSGTAKFEKRKNGTSLVTIDLSPSGTNLPIGALYPAQINVGAVANVGPLFKTKTLNPIDGNTKISITNVRALDATTAITYDNWLVYNGFITIHSATDTTNIIAKGNIGAN